MTSRVERAFAGRLTLLLIGIGLVAAPAFAQSTEFAANLTRGNQILQAGAIVQPFWGDTATSGWATVIVDRSARTLSYRVVVVNPPAAPNGRLFINTTGASVPVFTFTRPLPMSIILNNITDDFCYDIAAISFEGTIAAADLTLGREPGVSSADDIFTAVVDGKAYVQVGSTANPGADIRGQLTRRF
jgi:CHRD domain